MQDAGGQRPLGGREKKLSVTYHNIGISFEFHKTRTKVLNGLTFKPNKPPFLAPAGNFVQALLPCWDTLILLLLKFQPLK
jgi:hypothetical protein